MLHALMQNRISIELYLENMEGGEWTELLNVIVLSEFSLFEKHG